MTVCIDYLKIFDTVIQIQDCANKDAFLGFSQELPLLDCKLPFVAVISLTI